MWGTVIVVIDIVGRVGWVLVGEDETGNHRLIERMWLYILWVICSKYHAIVAIFVDEISVTIDWILISIAVIYIQLIGVVIVIEHVWIVWYRRRLRVMVLDHTVVVMINTTIIGVIYLWVAITIAIVII